jgi:hypothetical protein
MAAAGTLPLPGMAQPLVARAQQNGTANGAAQAAWQTDLEQRHAQLVARNGPGSDAALRTQLLLMGAQDQQARGLVNGQPVDKSHYTQASDVGAVDARLTAELKTIVAKDGWPTIALVGDKASSAAMLILIHTRDHAWQRSLLPQLEGLADAGKIDGSYVATLIDKELVSEGKLQRYGTQFKFLGNGEMAMYGVEDPAELDTRRAKVFLPPMAAYERLMSQMYHLKVSNKIVMATAPAAP